MIRWLPLLLLATAAQAQDTKSYVPQKDLATCLARSEAQCKILGCDGVATKYWWVCQALKDGTAVLAIEPKGPFSASTSNTKGTGALAPQELSTSKSEVEIAPLLADPAAPSVDAGVIAK